MSRILRARVAVTGTGDPLGSVTLEHIVPRAWFGRREAAGLLFGLDGPEDPRNLALACARCNHGKGKGPDRKGPATLAPGKSSSGSRQKGAGDGPIRRTGARGEMTDQNTRFVNPTLIEEKR